MPKLKVRVDFLQKITECPSQWVGITACGRKVFVRYKKGFLAVFVGKEGDFSNYAVLSGERILGILHGSEGSVTMTEHELISILEKHKIATSWARMCRAPKKVYVLFELTDHEAGNIVSTHATQEAAEKAHLDQGAPSWMHVEEHEVEG